MFGRRCTASIAVGTAAVAAVAYLTGVPSAGARSVAATVSGVITNASGGAVSGARVEMFAWPASAAQTRLIRIGSARTGRDGHYALTPDLSALPAGYVLPGGGVNADLDTFTGSAMQSYSMSLAAPTAPDAALATFAVGGLRTATVSMRFGRAAGTVTDTLAGSTTVHTVATSRLKARQVARAATSAASADWNCDVSRWGSYLRPHREKWVRAWGWRNAHVTVHEQVGSSHSLGVAAQTSGGGWSADGAASIETTTAAGGTVGYGGSSRLIYNSVSYRHARMTCEANIGSYSKSEIRPYRFADIILSYAPRISGNTFYHCATKYRGTWTKDQGRNKSFSRGVSIPDVGSLTSQASFSHDTELSWHVTGFTRLCGNDDTWIYATETGVHGKLTAPCRPSPGKPC